MYSIVCSTCERQKKNQKSHFHFALTGIYWNFGGLSSEFSVFSVRETSLPVPARPSPAPIIDSKTKGTVPKDFVVIYPPTGSLLPSKR